MSFYTELRKLDTTEVRKRRMRYNKDQKKEFDEKLKKAKFVRRRGDALRAKEIENVAKVEKKYIYKDPVLIYDTYGEYVYVDYNLLKSFMYKIRSFDVQTFSITENGFVVTYAKSETEEKGKLLLPPLHPVYSKLKSMPVIGI